MCVGVGLVPVGRRPHPLNWVPSQLFVAILGMQTNECIHSGVYLAHPYSILTDMCTPGQNVFLKVKAYLPFVTQQF